MCVCYMFCVQVPTEARRGCWNLGMAIKGSLWDGHYGCWELNLNPLQEWRMNALNRRAVSPALRGNCLMIRKSVISGKP